MSAVDHEMQRVGRIIAADQALEVCVRGVKAFAVPGRVTIPNLEHYDWLGVRYARRMLHGLLDHECGHASDTDFGAIKNWRETAKPCDALSTLQNLVEDGYVERKQGARYRGSATNIRLMNEWFYVEKHADGKSLMDRWSSGDVEEEDLLRVTLAAIGAVLTPHGHLDIPFFERLNPAVGEILRHIEPELEEAQAVTHTRATPTNIELAQRMFDKLAALGVKQSTSQTSDKGVSGEGEEPGKGKNADAGTQRAVGDVLLDIERWTDKGGNPIRASDFINARVRSAFEMPREVPEYVIFSHEFDVERDFSAEDMADLTDVFLAAKHAARSVADAMIFAFEAALRATALVTPVSGADEGLIDPELLAQYAVGSVPSDQLYMQLDEGDSDQTAVEILVDCSGSMAGEKAELAKQTAIAMHMALQACQIAHEVTGFTTLDSLSLSSHPWASERQAELQQNFDRMRVALNEAEDQGVDTERFARARSRYNALMVPYHAVFKAWHSNDARGLMHIAGLDQNLDGEGVMWAARRLAKRPERRKVLFVVSDGYPSGSRDNAQGHRYLEQSVSRVIAAGIEVYGLGICSDAVQKFYPLWWRADAPSDLITIAMTGLTTVLTRNRRERARVFL